MSAMPTVSLDSSVALLPGVGPKRRVALEEAGLFSLRDLLLYLPFRYLDASEITPIAHLQPLQTATIHAKVVKHFPVRNHGRKSIILTTIEDETGQMTISFFNQSYVMKNLAVGERYAFTGQARLYKNRLSLSNPAYEALNRETNIHTGRIIPVYAQTQSLSMRWVRQLLYQALFSAELRLPEYLPEKLLVSEGLMSRDSALKYVHFPEDMKQAKLARRRLAFDELWELFKTLREQDEARRQEKAAASVSVNNIEQDILEFESLLPFKLSETQKDACRQIGLDFSQTFPTRHIVQGEVGSGKTLVAAFGLLRLAKHGYQVLYLAPTTILARQHWQTLQPLAEKLGLNCSLWTSQAKGDPSAEIIVGTHALLQGKVDFKPALVVSDEEHRFGVEQREYFLKLKPQPHLISMTATPIPRTLATIMFTNQSTSFLDLIPGKEKLTNTRVFSVKKLKDHFAWLNQQVTTSDQQAFLIAPFIHPSETEGFADIFDAHSLFELAKQNLPDARIALLTGEDSESEKSDTLEKMHRGELDVLVATPVIEVGIDLPNASIITITSAERFGLAQLHQLRGRVGRQGQASWCFLVPSPGIGKVERLKKLEVLNNGRELAELDLQTRGVGEFLGTRQSGWDTLEIASWFDLPLLKQVQEVQSKFPSIWR